MNSHANIRTNAFLRIGSVIMSTTAQVLIYSVIKRLCLNFELNKLIWIFAQTRLMRRHAKIRNVIRGCLNAVTESAFIRLGDAVRMHSNLEYI